MLIAQSKCHIIRHEKGNTSHTKCQEMEKQPQLVSLPNVFQYFKSLKEVHDIKTGDGRRWKKEDNTAVEPQAPPPSQEIFTRNGLWADFSENS